MCVGGFVAVGILTAAGGAVVAMSSFFDIWSMIMRRATDSATAERPGWRPDALRRGGDASQGDPGEISGQVWDGAWIDLCHEVRAAAYSALRKAPETEAKYKKGLEQAFLRLR